MDQQEFSDWAKRQDVVKVKAIKENEEDKFILTVGNYMVAPTKFDSQEEAEQYLETNLFLYLYILNEINLIVCLTI